MGTIGIPASGGTGKYQVIAHVDPGAKVMISNSDLNKMKEVDNINGVAVIGGLQSGLWILRTELEGHSRTRNVYITAGAECQIFYMHFNRVPNFSYSGSFAIVTDGDAQIAGGSGTIGDWKIRFLTSGTLIFNDLKGQYIDIFLVGGGGNGEPTKADSWWGGSGGGGGYTKTLKNFRAEERVAYTVTVAARCGSSKFASSNSATNLINITAAGGQSGYKANDNLYGGNGGSGGGAGAGRTQDDGIAGYCGSGGSDGDDGTDGHEGWWGYYEGDEWISMFAASYGGEGQGRTTREFEDNQYSSFYSPGGAGGANRSQYDGTPGRGLNGANSGAGGSATTAKGFNEYGQSGIVIIRNSRGQYGFE